MATPGIEVNISANVSGQGDVDKLGAGVNALGQNAQAAGAQAQAGASGLTQLGAAAKQAAQGASTAASGLDATVSAARQAPEAYGKTRQGLESISKQLAATQQGLVNLAGQLAAGFGAQAFIQAAADMEKMQAGLAAVSGDASVAREQMDFVRQMANRAGVDAVAAGQAFLGLAAATKGTAVEGEPARQVFEAVTVAMAKAGKSSAETQNALLALSQIASKGTVSMEELRGQLGEALPGALQAAANGLGITTQDLIQLVETGQLAAEDLFPALASGLNELYGSAPSAQTLSQEITNIKNAFLEMAANIGESGGLDALKAGAELAQTAITLLGSSLVVTGKELGVLIAAVTTLDFSLVREEFAAIEAEARDKLVKAAQHNTVLAAAIRGTGDEATKAALATAEAGTQSEKAGQQSQEASSGVVALGSAYAKVSQEVSGQIALADKELESSKARGAAAIAQAKLLGDEAALRTAIAQAAANEAQAAEALAALKQTEVDVLRAELEAKRALLAQQGEISAQKQKELKDLEASIALKQADADKTAAQAAASRAKAQANTEEAQAARTNTLQLQAQTTARVADAQVALSGLQAQKELARQAEEMARLMGDEAGARRAKIQQIEIEIKITQAKVQVSKAEAEGAIAVAQAKLAELQATGELTGVKRAELEASIKLAQAKLVEANAVGQSTKLLEAQINALRNGTAQMQGFGDASGSAADRQTALAGSTDRATAALERQNAELERTITAQEKANDLKERADALERRRKNVDKDGFTLDNNGNRLTQTIITPASAYNDAKSMGLDDRAAMEISRYYENMAANDQRRMDISGFNKLVNDRKLQDARRGTGSGGVAGVGGSGGSGAPALGGTAKTYNVQVGTTTIRTVSDADAQALLGVLRQARLSA